MFRRRQPNRESHMRSKLILGLAILIPLTACSPRDFLTRRLAFDLLVAAQDFKTSQPFVLRTGVVGNKDYPSPDYMVLQHHGWIVANPAACPPGLAPPPCWNILLTPLGVETVRSLVSAEEASKPSLPLPVARREVLAVSGISEQGSWADVEFVWKWVPLNEVGAALYSGDLQYKSTVGFRKFDDGWRVAQTTPHPGQTLDDALRNAEPAP